MGDTVAVRSAVTLEITLRTTILGVSGNPASPPLSLCVDATAQTLAHPGDILEPLSATPSAAWVSGCKFTNSRASGIILQTDNARVEGTVIANVSSAAIAVGGYWNSFSESPFGAYHTRPHHHITPDHTITSHPITSHHITSHHIT